LASAQAAREMNEQEGHLQHQGFLLPAHGGGAHIRNGSWPWWIDGLLRQRRESAAAESSPWTWQAGLFFFAIHFVESAPPQFRPPCCSRAMDTLWEASLDEEEPWAVAASEAGPAAVEEEGVALEFAPELGLVDAFVAPGEVLSRIERLVEELVHCVLSEAPSVPPLLLRAARAKGTPEAKKAAPTTPRRLLHSREGASVVRLWRVLAECHGNLLAGRTATQRELYYTLADGATVRRAAEVNAAIQDATRLLRVPRACLAVTCASRGVVAGALRILEDNVWSDLSASTGRAIPGSVQWVADVTLRSEARCVLVVEKDAVFSRLLQEGACAALHAVMLTARGQPDLATRAFLARLAELLPDAPVLGLVDWNPSGVHILSTYRFGSARMAMEGERYRVDVKWLAARAEDLAHVDDEQLRPLTPRDEVLLRNLLASPRCAPFANELRAMETRGLKAELEALYDVATDLTPLLLRKILRADYL